MGTQGAGRLSRRRFLGGVGAATAAVTVAGAVHGPSAFARPAGRRSSVAVLGGGNSGLTVAHHLAERGIDVTVYERKALGGKSRTITVPGSGVGGRRDLPGEHGFRFFAGFYQNSVDTLRGIPYPGNVNGVYDNLVETEETVWVRGDGRANSRLLGFMPDPTDDPSPAGMRRMLEREWQHSLGVDEGSYLAERVWMFLTSSDERRFGQWEHVSWWDFIGAEQRSAEYQRVAGYGLSTLLVAGHPVLASTRTIGTVAEAFIFSLMGRGYSAPPVRILNAPTNEAWIDPWVSHLRNRGVNFEVGWTVEQLEVSRHRPGAGRGPGTQPGCITGAIARAANGQRSRIEADWFVVALPAERARMLWNTDVLALDPQLAAMDDLHVAWMNGIMYYLRAPVDVPAGHLAFLDSPWAITAIAQQRFWPDRDFARDYGDGGAVDCLSAIVSEWNVPGQFNGKPARECTAEEIQREVWAQMKAGLEKEQGHVVLPDGIVHTWFLDPAITWSDAEQQNANDEPLLINTVSSWEKRPPARSAIPNLFIAGDHVQTSVDLATMEGADEAGRRAVNALLDASGSAQDRVPVHELFDPPEMMAAKQLDAELYRQGQPHAFDRDRQRP